MATTIVSSCYNDIQLETIQEVPSSTSCSTSCSNSSSTTSSSQSRSPSSQSSTYQVPPVKFSPGYRNIPNGANQQHKKGQRIGNYILGKTIGSGTSSKVKIGTNIHTGKQYAIKITKPKRIKERKEIEREISILKRLKHDNIIQLHDAIYEDDAGRICLILELVSGGELFDYIVARGRLSEKEGRKFFRQMLCGLIYCHSNMVCHRDLKLENLLVDEDGNLKISDFGYSNIVKPGNLLSTFCGSPVYAPPEILLEKRYNGTEVDIWSIGVILYAMVTGQLPWTLTDGVQVEGMDRLLRGEFKYPSHVILSDDVKDLINRMIVAEPMERAKLDEIKSHVWVNKGYEMEPDDEYNKKLSDRLEREQQTLLNNIQRDQQQSQLSPRSPRNPISNSNNPVYRPLNQSSPNLTVPKNASNTSFTNIGKPIQFNSVACLDEKKVNFSAPTSPQYNISPSASSSSSSNSSSSNNTPPLSPLSVSGQKSPPSSSNNLKNNMNTSNGNGASLFHNIFKKRSQQNNNSNNTSSSSPNSPTTTTSPSNSNHHASLSANTSPLIIASNTNVDGAAANAPISSSSKRRFSLEDLVKAIRGNSNGSGSNSSKSKNVKIRTMKGPFNSGTTTTTMNPTELIALLEENLNFINIGYRRNCFVFDCKIIGGKNETINFSIEVCKVNGMEMHGIKFKRLCGDAWCYSSTCIKIVESLKL